MNWSDEAIIIGAKKFAENGLLVSFFSKEHGFRRSLAKSGQSKKQRPIFQLGNVVNINFAARTNEQLGSIQAEIIKMNSAEIMENQHRLQICNVFSQLLAKSLPENYVYTDLYNNYLAFIEKLNKEADKNNIYASYSLLECDLLQSLGYGYDLSRCAATGGVEQLIYISPKTAKAVNETAGEAYKDKLFKLPELFKSRTITDSYDINNSLKINAYFLQQFIFNNLNQELPDSRKNLSL